MRSRYIVLVDSEAKSQLQDQSNLYKISAPSRSLCRKIVHYQTGSIFSLSSANTQVRPSQFTLEFIAWIIHNWTAGATVLCRSRISRGSAMHGSIFLYRGVDNIVSGGYRQAKPGHENLRSILAQDRHKRTFLVYEFGLPLELELGLLPGKC
jgi:hypothetical protein